MPEPNKIWAALDAARERIAELERERAKDADHALTLMEGFKRERDEARAQVERMRPVLEAAKYEAERVRGLHNSDPTGLDRFMAAVDAYRAGEQS